jgi:hypothetical protein
MKIHQQAEDYRWNSLGYHVQTNNRDNFLSTDFGLKEFNVKSKKECISRYRRYVYEAGAINCPDKIQAKVAYSARFRPPIPGEAGHRFRLIPATHSGGSRPPIPDDPGHPN